jgi:hypothetical protein
VKIRLNVARPRIREEAELQATKSGKSIQELACRSRKPGEPGQEFEIAEPLLRR